MLSKNEPKKFDDLQPGLTGTGIGIASDSNKGDHKETNTMDVVDMITNMVTAHELGVAIPADIDGCDDHDNQDSILNGDTVRTEIEMNANVDVELSEVRSINHLILLCV